MAIILIADDDPPIRELLQRILENQGHTVVTFSNGKGIFDFLKKEKADLVITDLIMPDKEGLETIRELQQTHPEIKVIAMSGGGRDKPDDYLNMALAFGAGKALTKPFTKQEVISAINEALS
ncbi:MAG: response regulator [Desulfobulbaceae bacterium]|nr:response regulator [Desulfobulbaceae bacterium]MCK5341341.1 response regulator [Desulfobulbaceae bacterium]MCK5404375.1 response regulator [Desulfobulbaceae bacterium]